MVKLKGLGRGLDALLSSDAASDEQLRSIAVEHLQAGKYQPRSKMNKAALSELAESIKTHGVMQPILVRPIGAHRYEIIAGERRWRAAQIAGLREVPALVREIPDQSALAVSLVENIQREDLNPLEEAQGLKRLLEEFQLTHERVAQAVGRSRSAVSNLLRLLQLAKPVQEYVLNGALEMGHARALLALSNAQQLQLAQRAVEQDLSVREVERMVSAGHRPSKKRSRVDPDLIRLQEELSDSLGTTVKIAAQRKGGRIIIEYRNLDQLDGLLSRLRTRR